MSYLYITSIIFKEEYHMNDILKDLKETATNVLNANEKPTYVFENLYKNEFDRERERKKKKGG